MDFGKRGHISWGWLANDMIWVTHALRLSVCPLCLWFTAFDLVRRGTTPCCVLLLSLFGTWNMWVPVKSQNHLFLYICDLSWGHLANMNGGLSSRKYNPKVTLLCVCLRGFRKNFGRWWRQRRRKQREKHAIWSLTNNRVWVAGRRIFRGVFNVSTSRPRCIWVSRS